MRPALWLFLVLVTCVVDAKRRGGGSSSRKPGGFFGGGSRQRTPAPPPQTHSSNHFLDSERASSSGTTINRGDPFKPSAPQIPKQTSPQHTNGPIGFENVGGNTNQGNHKIGFDKVNSEVQNKPGGSYTPNAPNYPGASPPHGPPPAYYPGTHTGGINEHPPAYPGRPVGAPPTYSANNPYNPNNPQPGFGTGFPQQGQGYHTQHSFGTGFPQQGQGYHTQQSFGTGFPQQGQGYHPQQSFGNNYGSSYPQQNHFGSVGPGSYPAFGNPSYPGHNGYNPGYGSNTFGNSYQGNTFGGSPFGNTGYNSNPYYNPNNFGYSNNPGYFGSQGGYSGYNGYQKKSGFGGLPIPIPIPIPIPLGGGGFGGFGGFSGPSYHHRLLDSFIKDKSTKSDNSTSVFILNNSTVTPCTTDHFIYPMMKVTVVSCTAEFCTGVKIFTTTNVSNVESVHSAGMTMCLEQNVTFSYHGVKVTPTASKMVNETLNVCRDVPANVTGNVTTNINATLASTVEPDVTTTDATTTTTTTASALNHTANSTSRVCEDVHCWWVQMCMPAIEIVDNCNSVDCPFRRTGYKPCVTVKMCRSPSTPISTFATLNTTVSKIDEYNRHQSVYEVSNLTLISYHRPVIVFNCSQNVSSPGCPPPQSSPAATPQLGCPTNSTETVPGSPVLTTVNNTMCSTTPTAAPSSSVTADPGTTTAATSSQPSR